MPLEHRMDRQELKEGVFQYVQQLHSSALH